MFVITIVTINNHEAKIHDVYDDEMAARDKFIKLAVESIKTEDKYKTYEAVHININEIHIYRKSAGYICSTKDLHKILVLHELCSYDVKER